MVTHMSDTRIKRSGFIGNNQFYLQKNYIKIISFRFSFSLFCLNQYPFLKYVILIIQ